VRIRENAPLRETPATRVVTFPISRPKNSRTRFSVRSLSGILTSAYFGAKNFPVFVARGAIYIVENFYRRKISAFDSVAGGTRIGQSE